MDPLSALGLAANIVQFVEFGATVFRETKEIAEHGSTVSSKDLASLAADFSNIAGNIKRNKDDRVAVNLSVEEKALCDLAQNCIDLASEIAEALEGVSASSSNRSTWENVVKALRNRWSRRRTDELARRLGDYRSQLTLRLLLVLNSQHKQGENRLEALQDEIVEVISLNTQRITSAINQRSAETLTAILTTRDGSSKAVSASRRVDKKSQSNINGSFEDRILDALHFREIVERRATVAKAHDQTFEWVWADSADHSSEDVVDNPDTFAIRWSHLGKWLCSERGENCYWISGKAGSGKSSLMRYLQEHPKTTNHLKQWAGSKDLIPASFYFWYAGTDLQKSQKGLLRSLLLQLLSARRDLIALVFPDICRAVLSGVLTGHFEITHLELRAAIIALIENMPPDLKICLMIDGLDEYTGDQNELCDLIHKVSSCSSIKIIASSRPIPVCVARFDNCPTLRLQDLTLDDIQTYVWDTLGEHPLTQRMEKANPGMTSDLVRRVTSRAQGVFLWIHIVVKNLIKGLQNYNTVDELREEIELLPPDLE
ncbi:hypothetical protein EJ04DRAFT_586887, partial [Polyplosphaeria fusca]